MADAGKRRSISTRSRAGAAKAEAPEPSVPEKPEESTSKQVGMLEEREEKKTPGKRKREEDSRPVHVSSAAVSAGADETPSKRQKVYNDKFYSNISKLSILFCIPPSPSSSLPLQFRAKWLH